MKKYNPLVLLFLDVLGVNALCRFLNRNKAVVVWYHGVCGEDFNLLKDYDERHIPVSIFRKHLWFLKKKGYSFATMSELAEGYQRNECGKRIVLTFDDGFRNVVENAYPAMAELGARGCYYLVSGLVGTSELLWTDYVETVVRNQESGEFVFLYKGQEYTYTLDDRRSYEKAMLDIKGKLRSVSDRERQEHLEQFGSLPVDVLPKELRMVDWEEVKGLKREVLEIGCHTKSHPNCVNLTTSEEFDRELQESKVEIERAVGYKVDHFCYPAGSYNDEVIEYVKKCGYQTAVDTEPGFFDRDSDVYRVKRFETNESYLNFKSAVSGSTVFLERTGAFFNSIPFLKGAVSWLTMKSSQ